MVFSKIWEYQNIQDKRPTTPPSTSISDTILDRTPQSAKEIIDQGMVLHRRLLVGKKGYLKYLSRFIKGSMASAYSRQIVEDELKSVQCHATAKAVCEKLIEIVAKRVGLLRWGM